MSRHESHVAAASASPQDRGRPGRARGAGRGADRGGAAARTAPSAASRRVVALALLAGAGLAFGLGRGGGSRPDASAARADPGGAATAARPPGLWGPVGGPDGGATYAVAVAPSAPQDVYVGSGRGVFRSTNGGRTWTSTGPLPASQSWFLGATSLVVDPGSPTTLYAGRNWRWAGGMSYGQAVVKSTDGGRTWHVLALHGQPIASTPTAVYALTGGPRKAGRLVRSSDGGRTWEPANSGLPSAFVWGLGFDRSSTTVYAAMGTRGVFASADGGAHWRSVGFPGRYGEVTSLAVDPRDARTVYAAADAGVVVSRDGAGSWRMLNPTIGNRGRDRWFMQVSQLLLDPGNANTLYASTRCAGVFKSTDGGSRWIAVNAGLDPGCPWAYALAVDPRAPRTIYAADPTRGVLKSVDGATDWQAANDGLSVAPVWALAVEPHALYAGTGALGLFKSGDGGAHWRTLATGLPAVYALAADPGDPARLVAAGATTLGTQTNDRQLAVTNDGGRTWTTAGFGGRWVSVAAISGQTAYAGSGAGLGVFGTTDGGHSWHRLGPTGVRYVQALAINPRDSAVVYAGVYGAAGRGLYKSADGGQSWTLATGSLDIDVNAIAVDPRNPSTLYIGTSDSEGGVFKSTDGGTTWQAESTGLRWRVKSRSGKWITPTMPVSALAIDPVDSATLYAVTARGVYRSTDAGRSWHAFNNGLAGRDVKALALDATGQIVYAGTGGEGVVSVRR